LWGVDHTRRNQVETHAVLRDFLGGTFHKAIRAPLVAA
jgi:hypothetical protein